MAYDPFDPTNQNVIAPYARAGATALGNALNSGSAPASRQRRGPRGDNNVNALINNAATSLGNAAGALSPSRLSRGFDLNAPNYSLIAPANRVRQTSVTTRQRGSARNAPAEIPTRAITTNRRGQQQGGGADIDAFVGNALTSGGAPASRERRGPRGDNDVFSGLRNFFGGLSLGASAGANPALAGTLRGQGGVGPANADDQGGPSGAENAARAGTNTTVDPLAVGEGEGVIRGVDSGRTVRGTNADSARLNTFNLKEANKDFARANEIRRQTIADLGGPTFDPSQVVIAGGGQGAGGDLRSERLRLAKALEDGTGNFQRNFRALQALDDVARTDAAQAGLAPNAADLAALGLRQDQFGLQQDQFALDQAKYLNAPVDFKEQEFSSTLAEYRKALENGLFEDEGGENLKLSYQTQLRSLANGVGVLENLYESLFPQQPEEFANGGLVGAIETYANGGMISPSGPPPMPAIMQQYQQYADGARQMGLTAVPFEQFASLQSSSKDTIQSFEDGGMVSDADVSGKMIVDTDPNAPTDSIPAVIDGERPAALDSGEFVIPKDVVLYYGTDKLQKMIDKVRNPQGGQGNGGTQTALGI